MVATIQVTDETVTWSDLGQPDRKTRSYGGLEPFLFERVQYDETLADLRRALGESRDQRMLAAVTTKTSRLPVRT